MAIKLTLRDGAPQCLYCHDDVVSGGVLCPKCGVRYHDECAVTFLRCGVLGCKVPLLVPRDAGQPMPRLPALAPRLMSLDTAAQVDGDDHVVVLLPGSRDDPERAAFLGQLLGATTFDGRARLVSPAPEPLLRVSSRAAAEGLCLRLAQHGLRAVGLRADAFLRPLLHVAVGEVEPLAVPLRYRTASGREGRFPAPAERFVVTAQLVEERQRVETVKQGDGREKTERRTQRRVEQGALVFGHDPDPLLLRRDVTRIHGLSHPTAFARFAALLVVVSRDASVVDFKGSSSPLLLARRRPITDQVSENVAGVLLAARVLHAAWLAGV